jgi:serine phosphatase RsbU (regulator of sigma subunit)
MNLEGQMYGISRLRAVVAGRDNAPLEQIQKGILEAVHDFTRGTSQGDDITLLLIRYRVAAE